MISIINAVLTAKKINSKSDSLGNTATFHHFLSIIYLTAVWFVIRRLGIDYLMPLLGAAIGLTIPSILFAITIAKHMKGDE